MKRKAKPDWIKQLALERIEKLLKMAEENTKSNPSRSKRYVELAGKISTRYTVPIPKNLKRKFCKKCKTFWVPGKNVKIRANKKTKCVEYVCLECSAKRRVGYSRAKK